MLLEFYAAKAFMNKPDAWPIVSDQRVAFNLHKFRLRHVSWNVSVLILRIRVKRQITFPVRAHLVVVDGDPLKGNFRFVFTHTRYDTDVVFIVTRKCTV